ncbi:MAG: class I SAM-dependent methyltransferase [Solirubrobacterales bacterium]|nr:class I SAM-dependent methyltransferase [Solirubrobacterales bacterium]MCB8971246.1 class I SAM-dependent methyltransferase [Thermoleophilales bacterium]MCO5325899.1 class I SAM-dependent methyltransferase [Solirubrobacterales bacterium]
MPNASDHILEMPISYRVWQAPFAEAKFAPVLAHNDLSAVRRVLDVGCGPGTNAAHFAGSDYVGIDLNPRYIEDAKRRHGRDFRVADATEFSVPEGERFDFILINSFLHHIPDEPTRDLLGNLRRALAPDGHIHVMELVLPPRPCMGRLLARLDRGDFARPLESWRELLGEHFDAVVFEPYPLGAAWSELTTLWHMVYFKGAGA